ncbi:2Fe-2S iron-sulfur cluster-binding protein [Neptunicoccus sediminis]|uniref:2Fe-2S iron-sulfur cluster-binding protein n=1 Tax=Neptunicoccus sediminis TaxID=1892596 RepID=UPI0008460AFB|nr:2Fe-2S iron-sulfur cluster-binding protein [Neptunicoccus sediminis]
MPDAPPDPVQLAGLRRGLMIGSGLVMFAFLTCHLTNLALGLHSVALMDSWRWALSGLWTGPVMRVVLGTALVLHFSMALVTIYCRNTLRLPSYDMAQLVAGVLIVPLLAPHVFGIMAYHPLGLVPTYDLVLRYFWTLSPFDGLRQVVMLVVAWLHGTIGVYTWLRSRDGSARSLRVFYPFVVIVPVLALLGYVEAGRQIIPVAEGGGGYVMAQDPNAAGIQVAPQEAAQIVAQAKRNGILTGEVALVLVALAFAARALRIAAQKQGQVQVTYLGRRKASFAAQSGLTLLEMARLNDVPHANVCRGRGRCGTCRVRVLQGAQQLPPPDAREQKVLDHWNAAPNERLACQLLPDHGFLEVERVVQPDYSDLDYSAARTKSTLPQGNTP